MILKVRTLFMSGIKYLLTPTAYAKGEVHAHPLQVQKWWNVFSSPLKSVHHASCALNLLHPTVWKGLRKCLALCPYKLQLFTSPNDKVQQHEFCNQMMGTLAADETYLSKICFSDEEIFHLSRKVNRYNS